MLTPAQVDSFITAGFVKLERAFPRELADAGRVILWRATGCDPDDSATWTQPVVRLPGFDGEPFEEAVNTSELHAAFDQLVGAGRWVPRNSLGTFPIRFPSEEGAGDDGWHIDVSFAPPSGSGVSAFDFMRWRVNLWSKERALLMLFLFSDIGVDDAPTRIRVGSHLRLPKLLEPYGVDGAELSQLELDTATADLPEVLATGRAGDVYLCHPFLVHAAQRHRGHAPRFLAQPPLQLRGSCVLDRRDGGYSPVEEAIRRGLVG